MAGQDKRASTRHSVDIEMQLVRGDQALDGRTLNLSLGGALMRVSTAAVLRVGERVDVSFRLPDLDRALTAKADVRWIDDADAEIVGIQFVTGFRAKETWALGRFLDRQPPA